MITYSFYESDTRVLQYATALTGRGDSVDVIALRNEELPRSEVLQRARVLRIMRRTVDERRPIHYLLRILAFLALAAIVVGRRHLQRPYDVVHVHSVPDFLVFAALIPRILGSRIILDIHDILPELYASKFGISEASATYRGLLWCERLSAGFAHHVLVANDLWRDRLSRRSVAAGKCTTMRNYPDLRMFQTRQNLKRGSQFRLIYPGTLNRHQGVDIAVRAFARIAAEIPGAEFSIFGCGPERDTLAALIVALGMSDRVHLHEFVPVHQIAAIMADADVAVVPKRVTSKFGDEAASTKIMEFMALGVPVIASRTRIEQMYFDEATVLYVEPEDEEMLANAFRLFWGRPELRQQFAQRGLEYVRQHRWEEKKQEYFRLLEKPASASGQQLQAPASN